MSCPLLLLPLAAALAQPPAADPAREAALVNRITWGATPAELARIRELGPERYLQAQLHPAPGAALPPEVQRRIDALPISRQSDEDAQAEQRRLRQDAKDQTPDARVQAQQDARVIARDRADATADRAVWRALYSPNQLQEQMTWFWMNHFNVYAPRATWAPSSAAMKTAPSGRTRSASSATCWPRPSARRPCCCTWTMRRTRPARSTRTMRAS